MKKSISPHALLAVLCLWLVGTGAAQAQACACEPAGSPEAAYEQADLVFEGKVIGLETNWISGGWKFTFAVTQSWKQQTNKVYIVNTPWEKDCGYLFEEGETYLVYVKRIFTPKTNQCMGNRKVSEAAERLALLGHGYPPQISIMYRQMVYLVSGLALLGMLFLGFVIFRKKIRPHKNAPS